MRTILVIEDDHDTRVALRNCLEERGYFVVSCAHGARALELLEEMTLPDAILLDINMPIMNGDDFLRAVKNNEGLRQVPIIQMSAGSNPKRDGALYAIKKPLDLNLLFKIIEMNCFDYKQAALQMRTTSDAKEALA